MEKEKKGALFIIIAAILWGTTGTSQGLAPKDASSSAIGTFRILLGGLFLLSVALYKKAFTKAKWPIFLTFLGMMGVALYQLTFFYGVKYAGVAVGTVVGIGSSPISAGILSTIFLKEKLTKKWFISTILALSGLVLIGFGGNKSNLSLNLIGLFLSVMAGASYSFYTLISKKLLEKQNADAVMSVIFLGGAILLLPFLFAQNLNWIFTTRGILIVIHLGIFTTGISYLFFIRGLKYVKVSTTATLSLTEPLTATILGITVLKETPTLYSFIGIVLIFTGIIYLTLKN